jgi:ubiquinone biosynthesis protein
VLRRLSGLGRLVVRLSWVLALSLACGPILLLRRAFAPATGPRVLRWYFQRCGGAFVKCGQLLASRYDLLPARYCEELGRLLDEMPPVATARIRRCVERDLRAPLAQLYESFEDTPMATASLAQVHGATLPGGRRVVVKVLKPNVERAMRVDLACFRLIARALDALPVLRGVDVRFVVGDLSRSMLEEMDLRREARNTSFIQRRMAADGVAHYAPEVYRSHSAARVLTLERIDGVSVREIIGAMNRGDEAALAAWAAVGITPRRTAIILFRSVMEQVIRFRTFNADPHPSNLIVMPGGTLAWVDFGLVGWLDERQWELQIRLREALAQGRAHDAYRAMLRSMEPIPENRDLRAFEQEIKLNIRDYLMSADDPEASMVDKSAGVFLMRTLQALRRGRLPMTVSTVGLYRTILISDMVMLRLYPQMDWLGHMRRFLRDVAADLVTEAVETSLTSTYTAYRLARSPLAAADAVEWLSDRLPMIGAATLHTLSFWQRLALTGLRLLRAGTVVAAAVIVIGAFLPGTGGLRDNRGFLAQLILDNPWPALVGCGILYLVLGSLIRQADSS